MSRGWIIGIACLAVSGNSMLNGWAQDASPRNSGGISISKGLSALKDTFRRISPPAKAQKKIPKSNKQNAPKQLPQPTATSQLQDKSTLLQAQASEPVPEARYRRYQTAGNSAESTRRVTADSVSNGVAIVQEGRSSLSPARKNQLETALSDILSSEETKTTEPVVARNSRSTTRDTTRDSSVRSAATKNGSFDVYDALVDDEKESTPKREKRDVSEKTADPVPKDFAESDDKASPAAEKWRRKARPILEDAQPIVTDTRPEPENEQRQPTLEYPRSSDRSPLGSASDPFDTISKKKSADNPIRNNPIGRPLKPAKQFDSELLLSSQQSVIVSHVEGPRRIVVGHEANYQITLENTSNTDAKNIAATVRIPKKVDIVDVTSTNGVVGRVGSGTTEEVMDWKINELAARSSVTLRLRLIPRSGRPMQLGIQWTQAPSALEAMVEVQEPKLEIGLGGPQEVLFGQPQRYRLTLRNPGSGVAEQVVIQLIPPGSDEQSTIKREIGPLKAGEVKEIELELTANESGELVMQATAVANDGLSAKAIKKVFCRKPELQVDCRGPETKYAGMISPYYIRVRNPGTAMTEPVTVTFKLPEGSQFVSGSDGHSLDAQNKTVSWRLAGLDIDEAQYIQVRCQADRPGINRFSVTAKVDNGELNDTKTIQTNIVALADLKLEVADPQGPLPLGDPATYEIRVRNRGNTAAKDINIVGLFSAGIDPISVEGAQYTERGGRVTFHTIKSLPAGREIILRIRAKASQPGTHVFRAEVLCQDLDIKLAAEETTRFFEDEFSWEDNQTPYSAENGETVNR